MVYKDKEKEKAYQREYKREYMRKKRAEEKEKKQYIEPIKVFNATGNCSLSLVLESDRPITPEDIAEVVGKIKETFSRLPDEGVNELVGLLSKSISEKEAEAKAKKSFLSKLNFIPNLLSLHVDLKMLKQAGGC